MRDGLEERLGTPWRWVAAMVAVSLAATGLQTAGTSWGWVALAAAVGVALTVAAAATPWARLPTATLLVLPVGCDLVIALLRQAQGGSTSGYGVLAILPVALVGLLLGRREVAAMTATTVAMFAVPILAVGGTAYPQSGWRAVALWAAVAALVGSGAHGVMRDQRRKTLTSAKRARELDRIVATQSLIAASSFDLGAVLRTVVNEAQQLSGADAAVIEMPDGDELVYRSVSGSALRHLGFRMPRAAGLSGLALERRETLLSRDTETDPRVDRGACERIGARSMLVVPLVHDGEARGVLKVYAGMPDAFDDAHARLLALLADIVGGALVRADLLARLQRQAHTDQLTGLPNRRAWYERLDEALARARRHGHPVTVIVLDLDDFKLTNDTRGHAAGDRMLMGAGRRWSSIVRASDVVGRTGGDEFGVICEHTDAEAAAELGDRLRAALPPDQSVSVGAATWDGDETADDLVGRADIAMYEDKHQRRHALPVRT